MAGLRFVIWVNDHAPAHVHVFSADGEATIVLGTPGEVPTLIRNRRMSRSELAIALQAVFAHRSRLLQAWSELHG